MTRTLWALSFYADALPAWKPIEPFDGWPYFDQPPFEKHCPRSRLFLQRLEVPHSGCEPWEVISAAYAPLAEVQSLREFDRIACRFQPEFYFPNRVNADWLQFTELALEFYEFHYIDGQLFRPDLTPVSDDEIKAELAAWLSRLAAQAHGGLSHCWARPRRVTEALRWLKLRAMPIDAKLNRKGA